GVDVTVAVARGPGLVDVLVTGLLVVAADRQDRQPEPRDLSPLDHVIRLPRARTPGNTILTPWSHPAGCAALRARGGRPCGSRAPRGSWASPWPEVARVPDRPAACRRSGRSDSSWSRATRRRCAGSDRRRPGTAGR